MANIGLQPAPIPTANTIESVHGPTPLVTVHTARSVQEVRVPSGQLVEGEHARRRDSYHSTAASAHAGLLRDPASGAASFDHSLRPVEGGFDDAVRAASFLLSDLRTGGYRNVAGVAVLEDGAKGYAILPGIVIERDVESQRPWTEWRTEAISAADLGASTSRQQEAVRSTRGYVHAEPLGIQRVDPGSPFVKAWVGQDGFVDLRAGGTGEPQLAPETKPVPEPAPGQLG